jgi:hypothetical protein
MTATQTQPFNVTKEQVYKEARTLSDQFYEKLAQLKYPTPNQISSVGCAIGDLYESFRKIYNQLLPSFLESEDLEQLLDLLVELKLEFDHIKAHLKEAETGLLGLIRFVDEIAESDGGPSAIPFNREKSPKPSLWKAKR